MISLRFEVRNRGHYYKTKLPKDTMTELKPTTKVKNPILQLAQDSFNYKVRGDVEYVLTIRDLNQFTELFRIWMKLGISDKRVLLKALEGAIYVKYSDRVERELMIKSAHDTFPAR